MARATWEGLGVGVGELTTAWRAERSERQARTALDPADFAALRAAGLLAAVVPEAQGGLWVDVATSTASLCAVLRDLAGADPSVALVSAMHPAVVGFWLALPDEGAEAWREQRAAVVASAADGAQWGTITSEPGSGGDVARTTTVAEPDTDTESDGSARLPGDRVRLHGMKHFGSGSGVTDFMITTARAEAAPGPGFYVLDVRDRPWDGSAGLTLVAEWDGMGMAATQSHAMRLDGCPGVAMAWPGPIEEVTAAASPLIGCLFTAVVLGVLDEAVATAKAQLAPKAGELRPYEAVEWAQAELEHWLAQQALAGALHALESGPHPVAVHAALRAKEGVAQLAESAMTRITRVLGGGTYSRRSPFARWFEDVRALGFLRPPWGLAFDGLLATSLPPPG